MVCYQLCPVMLELEQDISIRHKDGMGIAGALAETASHDAQEGFNHFNFAVYGDCKYVLGADIDAIQAAIAQFSRNHREPGHLLSGKALPLAVVPGNRGFPTGTTPVVFLIFADENLLIFIDSWFGDKIMRPHTFDEFLCEVWVIGVEPRGKQVIE